MEVDNLMIMPEIEYNTNWKEQDEIWAEKEDIAWEDEKVKEMLN